jgi:sRNA-binding carbon storage regulator CsrA
MSVINRDLVETLGINEAVMVKWVRLEMEKVSVAVECPR